MIWVVLKEEEQKIAGKYQIVPTHTRAQKNCITRRIYVKFNRGRTEIFPHFAPRTAEKPPILRIWITRPGEKKTKARTRLERKSNHQSSTLVNQQTGNGRRQDSYPTVQR